jgi:hypothetical protein
MKIIARVSSSEFLIQANEHEIAKVCGHTWASGLKLEVGQTIEVTKLWQALEFVMARPKEVAEMAEKLRKAAENVDRINSTLEHPIIVSEAK